MSEEGEVVSAHRDEAVRLLDMEAQVEGGMTVEEIAVSVAAAQAHATLALEEQQRVANLIALATLTDCDEDTAPLYVAAVDALLGFTPTGPHDGDIHVRPVVAHTLGIDAMTEES